MEIILAALLAGKAVLPAVDRETLELQARAEALRPRAAVAASGRRPALRPAANPGLLDLETITTICRAAGNHAHPVAYVTRLGRAYELSANQTQALRSNCAAYLTARADTLRNIREPY
jgi:hypothetical protein